MAYDFRTTRAPLPKPPPLPQVPQAAAASAQQLQQAYAAFHPQQQALAPAAAQGSYPTPDLSFEDVNYFDTAKRQAQQSLGHGIAQDQYGQGQEEQAHNLAMQALNARYDEVRRRLPGTFINRGVGQSGIAAQGFQDYTQDRQRGVFGENLRYQQGVGQHRITQDQLYDVWRNTNQDLDDQRAARQREILANYNRQKAG